MFFLDPRKTGRISILKLVSSPIMEQVSEWNGVVKTR